MAGQTTNVHAPTPKPPDLTDEEWRVKIAFDLGAVTYLGPQCYKLGDEDVTNTIFKLIQYAHADTITRMGIAEQFDQAFTRLAEIDPHVPIPATKPWVPSPGVVRIMKDLQVTVRQGHATVEDAQPKRPVTAWDITKHLIKKVLGKLEVTSDLGD